MERTDVERIRNATFSEERRGFDRREVQVFLAELADWLEAGAADEARSYAVKVKLERAGETTARILATAEGEAEEMRREAQEDAARMVAEAEAKARDTIDSADRRAHDTIEAADRKARRTVEDGERRRHAIETVISDLVARRDLVLDDIEALGDKLAAAVAAHTPPAGADPFDRPAELDPAERGEVEPGPELDRSGRQVSA